jgi:hypothetical protein
MTMIRLDDRCEPRSTLGLEVNDMQQALLRKVKQRFETNKEILLITSLREAINLGLRCDLL